VIVRLTVRQTGRVRDLVAEALGESQRCETFLQWWDRDSSMASKHRVDTVMPAMGWRMVEGVMFDHCFDERGFRAKERVRATDINALKSIRRALNVRENHPALFQRGAIGLIPELVPAWKFPSPDASGKMYSPYPVSPLQFVVLAPESRVVQTKQTTLWVEALRPRELPLLDENNHWAFAQ
jgi:hypothetical protein